MAEIEGSSRGWKKSTKSAQGNCVEVRITDRVEIRDSNDMAMRVISTSRDSWQAFVDGVKAGEFDLG